MGVKNAQGCEEMSDGRWKPVQQAPCSWIHMWPQPSASDSGSPDGQVGSPSTCDGHTKNKHSLRVKVPANCSHALVGLCVTLPGNSPLSAGGNRRVPDMVSTREPNPCMRHPSRHPHLPMLGSDARSQASHSVAYTFVAECFPRS